VIGVQQKSFAQPIAIGEDIMKILFTFLLILITGPAKAFGICWPSCTETTELDERTIVVSARGSGLWSAGLNEDLMAAAASAALQHGYSKFILLNPNEATDYSPYGYFNYGSGFIAASQHRQTSAIVRFFNQGEPGAQGALDAQTILKRYGD
jgi:hypothetical protein